MLGASKILTVSYGTFSCTLEGFDEPFSTMKAIAEYFRDLAAEDRYFGAEPPTPDAAMLHRIAEREIQRRVEAKVQENGVILRAGDEGGPFAAAKPAAPPLLDAAPAPAESAADKLRRLRGEAAALPVAAEPVAEAVAVSAAPAPLVAVSAPVLASEYDEDEPLADLAAPLVFDEEPAPDYDAAPEADFGFDGDLDLEAPSVALADEFAAPVQDAAEAPSETAADEDFEEIAEIAAEPEIADDSDDAMLAALAAMDAPVAPAEAADLLPEDLASEYPDDDQDRDESEDDTAAMLAALVEPQAEVQPEPEAAAEAAVEAAPLALDDMIDPEDFGADDEEDEAAFAEDEAEASTGTEAIEAAELTAPVAEAPAAEPEQDPAESEAAPAPVSEKAQRARARVIRIRRSDAPAAAAPAPAAEELPRNSLLSPEAEAELQAELAALEAEIGLPEAEAAPAAPQPQAAPAAEAEPRRRLDSGADDSVSRLIARTDTEMDGEDTRRRRSAIEHLKAAVAATTAERQIHGAAPERGEDRKDAYRADLAQAVRPQRPEGERLSPLVLVSEQRIDRPRSTTSTAALSVASDNAAEPVAPVAASAAAPGPVRPRRVKAGRHAAAAQAMADLPAETATLQPDLAEARAPLIELPPEAELDSFDIDDEADDAEEGNVFSDSKSFGDFAERLGATQLPDLIEAAAVYCAMVLKRPEFSRPLVLRQVSDLPAGAGLAREDCLRSFGHLMRKGRIVKVRAGHFAVTERSPLLAEALRHAG